MRVLLLLSVLLMSFNSSAERILLDEQWRLSDVPGEAIYYQQQAATAQNGEWPVQLFYLETDKPVFKGRVNSPNLAESYIVGDFEFFYPDGPAAAAIAAALPVGLIYDGAGAFENFVV